jgi:cytochrome c peroxidase
MTPRVTGDPAVALDGSRVAILGLYVDNTSPITEEDGAREEEGGYSDRINPVVMILSVDDNGIPDEDAELAPIKAFDLGSYPASVAFSPDSEMVVAAMEGASSVAIVSSDVPTPRGDVPKTGFFTLVPSEVIRTEAGPRGIAFTAQDSAWVYCFLDRTVSRIEIQAARENVGGNPDESIAGFFDRRSASSAVVVVARSDLAPDVERGRRLFYSTDDQRVTSQGSSVSCGTCHFEGRADGITWTFDRGPRQTPSLAEEVSARAPLRWQGDRATIAIDAKLTAENLMGGDGLSDADAADIEAFVNSIRGVDLPLKGATDPEIELGRTIFFRPDVACGTCHGGALYSDLALHDLLGLSGVKTPSLIGVAATAPYFHDGSAQTLRDVLLRSRTGAMGNTGSLSDTELDALARFLETL